MSMQKKDIAKLSDTEIAQMFSDYVGRMEDKERHTNAACREVDAFDLCCTSEFPNNVRVQNLMYEKMMNTAIEFEESGFIAGFKTAMALLLEREELLPAPTNISSPESGKRLHEAVNDSQSKGKCNVETASKPQPEKYIDTTQIAKMFGRTNWKTCRTINNSVIPFLSEDEKKEFIMATKKDLRKKEQVIYKLTFRGCQKFLELCALPQFSVYASFSEGAELLKKEMEKVWCDGCSRHVA